MGFTTSFVGGLTLTYSVLYLTLHVHRQNRLYQSSLLQQQRHVLRQLYDPPSEYTESPAYEVQPAGLTEQLKDRWNRELSNAIRNLQEKDWEEARIRWERRAGNLWSRVGGDEKVDEIVKKAEELGEQVKESAIVVGQNIKEKSVEVGEQVKESAKDVGQNIKEKSVEVGEQVKESVKEGARKVERNVRDAAKRGSDELKRKTSELKKETKEVTGQKRLLEL